MRLYHLVIAVLVTASPAFAQTSVQKDGDTGAPAVAAPNAKPALPVAGANSFTEAQARERIERHGFSNVTGLMLDSQSIWRGKAMKDSKEVNVALDYQGNVFGQ